MADVKIIVTADTAQAAAALKTFCAQSASGLKSVEAAGGGSGLALTQVRQSSLLLRQGTMELNSMVFLLGGTHFPQLMYASMGVRSGLMGVRTAAMLTGVSMAALAIPIAAVVAVVGAAAWAWESYRAQQRSVVDANNEMASSLEKLPELLKTIRDAAKGGILPQEEADKLTEQLMGASTKPVVKPVSPQAFVGGKIASGVAEWWSLTKEGIGMVVPGLERIKELHDKAMAQYQAAYAKTQPGVSEAAQKRLAELGILTATTDKEGKTTYGQNEQLKELEDVSALTKKISDDALEGYAKERAALKQKHDDEINSLDERLQAAQKQRQVFQTAFEKQGDPLIQQEISNLDAAIAKLTAAKSIADTTLGRKTGEVNKKEDEELDKLMLDYAKEDAAVEKQITDELAKQEQLKQDKIRDDLEAKLAGIQQNPLLTDSEKAEQSVPVIQALIKANDDYIKQLEERADLTGDDDAYLEIEKQISAEKQKQVKLGYDLQAAQGQSSLTFNFESQWTKMSSQVGNLAHDMATMAMSPFVGMKAGLASAFDTLLEKGSSFKQFMGTIALSIGHSMIQAFSDMVANWIMSHIIMKGVSAAFYAVLNALGLTDLATHLGFTAAKTTAHVTGEGIKTGATIAGATVATGVTVAAATTQIGAHAAVAGAGAAASQAWIPFAGPVLAIVAMGAIIAAIMAACHAFAEGGRPMVGQLALVGERGPELWVPDSAGTIIPAHQTAAMLRGGGGRGMGGDGGGSQGGSKTNLSVYNFSDPRQLADHFEKNGDLEKHIVDVMGRNIHRFR